MHHYCFHYGFECIKANFVIFIQLQGDCVEARNLFVGSRSTELNSLNSNTRDMNTSYRDK